MRTCIILWRCAQGFLLDCLMGWQGALLFDAFCVRNETTRTQSNPGESRWFLLGLAHSIFYFFVQFACFVMPSASVRFPAKYCSSKEPVWLKYKWLFVWCLQWYIQQNAFSSNNKKKCLDALLQTMVMWVFFLPLFDRLDVFFLKVGTNFY
jgi:hypothetical protein